MTKRNWVEEKLPDVGVIWTSTYIIEVDALVGLPIWQGSKPAARALDRGIIREITKERAQELNCIFASDKWEGAVQFLEDLLAARWVVIARQVATKAPSCKS